MLVMVLLALATSAPTPTPAMQTTPTVVTVVPSASNDTWTGARWSLEVVVDGAAHTVTAGTAPTSAVALRIGGVNSIDAGSFWGLDGSIIVSNQSAGTVDVSVTQLATLLEARGLVGVRFRRGFVGVGAYGFGGLAGGARATSTRVFDDVETRTGAAWRVRAGGGAEVDVGPLLLRIETGAGVRDLAVEVFGAGGIGFRW